MQMKKSLNPYITSNSLNPNSTTTTTSISFRVRQDNDGNPASVMSDISYLIDDDHIDDQETINVGHLIIDLESVLDRENKEKNENEQANEKPTACTTTSAPSATSSFGSKASSSISATSSFKASADERGELKMRITRETKPGKNEHKIVTSPNQKSPTSSNNSNSNNNITSHANNCEDISLPESNSSISSKKECGTSTSIGTITEPDCLGPCEPGTSVTLEGIVWQETEGGILVVNVTWRGKTYVGALLDCTKHDWAPPRLCDSPASDIDSKAHKGVRTKRIVTRSNGIGLDEKNLLQTGKLRNGKGRRIINTNDLASCNKRQRESEKSNEKSDEKSNEDLAAQTEANTSLASVSSVPISETACVPMNIDTTPATNNESISTSNISTDKAGPNSPMLIGCSEPNCSKKYRNMNGLLYHQSHAHGADNDNSSIVQDSNCSTSAKEKLKPPRSPVGPRHIQEQAHLSDNYNTSKESMGGSKQPNPATNNESISTSNISTDKAGPNSPMLIGCSEPNCSKKCRNMNELLCHQSHAHGADNDNLSTIQDSNCSTSAKEKLKPPRSPVAPRHIQEQAHLSDNYNTSRGSMGGSKQSNPAPLPATTEEGMKPSGTSTGPPPAPHQANCYFNSAFLSQTFNPLPYGLPPYFRPSLPMYDPAPLAPPTSAANAAFISRFMSNMRAPPPPEPPSRLLSPSVTKNLPFPHFKVDPGGLPVPPPQMANPPLPNMSPLTNPPLVSGSPLLRMPSQGNPMLPPNPQPPFPPPTGL